MKDAKKKIRETVFKLSFYNCLTFVHDFDGLSPINYICYRMLVQHSMSEGADEAAAMVSED